MMMMCCGTSDPVAEAVGSLRTTTPSVGVALYEYPEEPLAVSGSFVHVTNNFTQITNLVFEFVLTNLHLLKNLCKNTLLIFIW